jgi:hypothetical protein
MFSSKCALQAAKGQVIIVGEEFTSQVSGRYYKLAIVTLHPAGQKKLMRVHLFG